MPLDDLVHRHRPSAGEPEGALVLLHGRGVDENDLFPLLDLIDPHRRLDAYTPRAPLRPPGHAGNHWYVVERVGHPDGESFQAAYRLLESWLEAVTLESGSALERMVLGGFSQGGVMSYALGLGPGRPRPAAILALSCFVPAVSGWQADFSDRAELPVYHSHGVNDPIITVEFGRQARELLEGRVKLVYREHPGGHTIDPRSFDEMRDLAAGAIGRGLDELRRTRYPAWDVTHADAIPDHPDPDRGDALPGDAWPHRRRPRAGGRRGAWLPDAG